MWLIARFEEQRAHEGDGSIIVVMHGLGQTIKSRRYGGFTSMAKYQWDVFISHASEDKDLLVRPLALALQDAGLRVWYDEHTLTLGDSLRRKIDEGISESRYGVVVLSPPFFAKHWPQRELDGLAAVEVEGAKVILPIWHNVSFEDVCKFSPTLADRLAASTTRGLQAVAAEIVAAVAQNYCRAASGGQNAVPTTPPPVCEPISAIKRGEQGARTPSKVLAVREVAEPRELTYKGNGVAAAVSCLRQTSDARLQWQVARRLVMSLRSGRSRMSRGALEAWTGPALIAWVRNDELLLSTLPGVHFGNGAPPPARLRVFVFTIEDQGLRLMKTLEFEGTAWEPVKGAAYRERFRGRYLDRAGADPHREAILEMLLEAGSWPEPPAVPNEAQVLRFGSFLNQQEERPHSADWDTDPLLVDPAIDNTVYGQSPSGHSVEVIRLQGSWSGRAISALNAWCSVLLRHRAIVVDYDWGLTRLVVAEPNRVRDRVQACLQSCIDTQYPVPWRRAIDPEASTSTNKWFAQTDSVALSDEEWTDFNNKVCVPLRSVEWPRSSVDNGWNFNYRHGGSPGDGPLALNWGL